ncbi:hypothetical protein ACTVJH_08070 [Desulfoplanes sp. PS50]
MSVIEKVAAPANFCSKESQRFWDTKGKNWWLCGKSFSALAFKAILEDAFGGEEHIETFCYDEERNEIVLTALLCSRKQAVAESPG